MEKITSIIEKIPIKTYFFMHDNTKKQLKKFGLYKKLEKMKHVEISKLKNYFEFIIWLKNSKFLLTDGAGIQVECLYFKKPCLILRKEIECKDGLKTKLNFLTKLYIKRTENKIKEILSESLELQEFKNPYGSPGVSKKIVDYLEEIK